ncbi:hypothetical protein NRIC_14810 [Enterococcus florum]|uniref:Uncharacterized protein n=1 Tax=Enterococcus florum TaxID=2480627 RepID=A0A4P5P732_9ENTE|nr:hypothetical protein [Enterococcus florum]GCF93590.1 hypothetical protein NRIC_14810 [Enterococcus florum]
MIKNENITKKPNQAHKEYGSFELKIGNKSYQVNSYVKKEGYQKLANSLLALVIQEAKKQEQNNE